MKATASSPSDSTAMQKTMCGPYLLARPLAATEVSGLGDSRIGLNAGSGIDIRPGWFNIDVALVPGIDVLCDVCHLPFKDRSFQVVFARDLLHHTLDPTRAVDELARVAADRLEIWESSRYNPYMLIFMIVTGFQHRHFSGGEFRRLFRGRRARFERCNNYDHFYSKPPYGMAVELLKRVSRILPAYTVAIVSCTRPSDQRDQREAIARGRYDGAGPDAHRHCYDH